MDKSDFDLGESFDLLYSVNEEVLLLHTYKDLIVPDDFKSIILLKNYNGIEYVNLLEKIKDKKEDNIKLYKPFGHN